MRNRRILATAILLALSLGGCGADEGATGPGGVSADDAAALDKAAADIDAESQGSGDPGTKPSE